MNWAALGLPEHGSAFNWRITPPAAPTPKRDRSMNRFTTVEAAERHRESQRAYAKTLTGRATKQRNALKAAATRVSKYTEQATPAQAHAARDKTRQIQASSNRYRTA